MLLLPNKSFALIEVDITRGNLSPAPLRPDFPDAKKTKAALQQANHDAAGAPPASAGWR